MFRDASTGRAGLRHRLGWIDTIALDVDEHSDLLREQLQHAAGALAEVGDAHDAIRTGHAHVVAIRNSTLVREGLGAGRRHWHGHSPLVPDGPHIHYLLEHLGEGNAVLGEAPEQDGPHGDGKNGGSGQSSQRFHGDDPPCQGMQAARPGSNLDRLKRRDGLRYKIGRRPIHHGHVPQGCRGSFEHLIRHDWLEVGHGSPPVALIPVRRHQQLSQPGAAPVQQDSDSVDRLAHLAGDLFIRHLAEVPQAEGLCLWTG